MRKITLSFDNGPDPDITPKVLDALRDHGIRTSFFVIGERLRDPARLALCERAKAEGHRIGNHTLNHLMPLGPSRYRDIAEREIGMAESLIGSLGESVPLFRPAGALGVIDQRLFNPSVIRYLTTKGYTCVLWNVVPGDWDDPEGWVETALEQCQGREWPLVVIHDIQTGAMKALESFLKELERRRYTICQDFPPDCVPIVGGEIVRPIEGYVTT